MFLEMHHDMQGDLLGNQESPGITFDITRLHNTRFQELTFLKILNILIELKRFSIMSDRIQNQGRIQLESTLKTLTVRIENASFGYELRRENLMKRCLYHRYWRTL